MISHSSMWKWKADTCLKFLNYKAVPCGAGIILLESVVVMHMRFTCSPPHFLSSKNKKEKKKKNCNLFSLYYFGPLREQTFGRFNFASTW